MYVECTYNINAADAKANLMESRGRRAIRCWLVLKARTCLGADRVLPSGVALGVFEYVNTPTQFERDLTALT